MPPPDSFIPPINIGRLLVGWPQRLQIGMEPVLTFEAYSNPNRAGLLATAGRYVKSAGHDALVNSCDLAKGMCDSLVRGFKEYLLDMGYDKGILAEVLLSNPRFAPDDAHPEWKQFNQEYWGHVVLKVGPYFVDLTGAQYAPSQAGVKVYDVAELGQLWGQYKVMEKDEDGRYVGGSYSVARTVKI